jgi:hypothetical protein
LLESDRLETILSRSQPQIKIHNDMIEFDGGKGYLMLYSILFDRNSIL